MKDDLEESSDLPVGKRLSLREVTVALKACNGSLPKAAEALAVDLYRLSRYIAVRPKLRDLSAKLRNMLVDIAEGHFSDAVVSGDSWAVKMALSTLGKDRGYTSKQEIDHRLINTTDPTKMSDQQLQALVEERARQQRIAAKQPALEAKVITPREVILNDGDFNDVRP
jgi:hypothetical protein